MPRRTDSNRPEDWLFFAEAEMAALSKLAEEETAYYMCLSKLAETVEKILKAELIRLGWFLERTHDLQKLSDELAERESDLTAQIEPLVEPLAESYFAGRYPGFDLEEPDWPELLRLIGEVAALLERVKARV